MSGRAAGCADWPQAGGRPDAGIARATKVHGPRGLGGSRRRRSADRRRLAGFVDPSQSMLSGRYRSSRGGQHPRSPRTRGAERWQGLRWVRRPEAKGVGDGSTGHGGAQASCRRAHDGASASCRSTGCVSAGRWCGPMGARSVAELSRCQQRERGSARRRRMVRWRRRMRWPKPRALNAGTPSEAARFERWCAADAGCAGAGPCGGAGRISGQRARGRVVDLSACASPNEVQTQRGASVPARRRRRRSARAVVVSPGPVQRPARRSVDDRS